MTEVQIPLMLLIALVGGMFAGLWAWHRRFVTVVILIAVVLLDTTGWIIYGFIVSPEPRLGVQQVVGGILFAGFGLVMFASFFAILGCFLVAGGLWLWKRFSQ